jgi:excisionase family DNA binding protein
MKLEDTDLALLTRGEVAALLRVSVETVDRLRREGQLRATTIGRATRYRPDELRRLIARSAAPPDSR